MTIALRESRILPAHRKRPYGLLDVIPVEYHSSDDLRWIMGVNAFQFNPQELIGEDFTDCDMAVDVDDTFGDPSNNENRNAVFTPFTTMLSLRCSTLSGFGTLDEMERYVGKEHSARLPNHVARELYNGELSGVTTSSLSTLAASVMAATPQNIIAVAEAASMALGGIEVLILIPALWFTIATEGRVIKEDGIVRTYTGNIVVPFDVETLTVYVVATPLKLHLSPKNIQIPKEFKNITTNTVYATSEMAGLLEFDPLVLSITIND